VGCAADTSDVAALFGDETRFYADARDEDLGGAALAYSSPPSRSRGPGLRRAGMVGRFLATAGRSVQQVMVTPCQQTSDFAERLGLGPAVCEPLGLGPAVCEPLVQAFERWDGKGISGTADAEALAPAIRLVYLADIAETFHYTVLSPFSARHRCRGASSNKSRSSSQT
jgi:hypothetical protein